MSAETQINRADWLAARRTGIGGSDVAPILGLSKWRSPLDVYMDKRGEAPEQPDNEAMLWGRALEPVIRQQYAERTGLEVMQPVGILTHPQHAFMLANVDGIAGCKVLEIKTARTAQGWGEPGSDEIPDAYALQVQHYMAVTGLDAADVAVLIGGSDFRIYTVPADAALQADMIAAEAEFWQRVQTGTPPPCITYADAIQRYGRSASAGTVTADAETYGAWLELRDAKAAREAAETREEAAKAILMRAMGDNGDTLADINGNALATWKLAKGRATFDTRRFTASHPDLAAEFTREGEPSRRFLIKEPK